MRTIISTSRTLLLLLSAALIVSGSGGHSHAAEQIGIGDELSPPRYQALTSGSVDPKTGEFLLETTDLSIGSGNFPSRLDLVRVNSSTRDMDFKIEGRAVCTTCGSYVYGDGQYPLNLRTDLWGGVNIVLFGTTYSFVQNGSGGYDNLKRDGANLIRSSNNKRLQFRGRDGLTAIFEFVPSYTCGFSALTGMPGDHVWSKSICQRVRYVETPDGQSISYSYVSRTPPAWSAFTVAQLAEVRNSRGYGIQFSYGDARDATLVTQATAFRTSCTDSSSVDCSLGSLASVTYQHFRYRVDLSRFFFRLQYVTDPNGKRTEYEYNPNTFRLIAARYPQNPTVRAFTNSYGSDGKIATQLDALSNQTTYSFGASETTVTDPLGHTTRYGFSGTNPLPAYIEDGNGNRTASTYDSYFRVTKIDAPEGNAIELELDDRGNATTIRRKPKPGSGLDDLVATASFPVCDDTNYRICNQHTHTVDARGARTDYAYDPAHGGLTVAIAPPDAQGLRAVTRVGYDSFTPAANTAPPALSGADNIPEAMVRLPVTMDRCLSSIPDVSASFVCPAADTVRTSRTFTPSTTSSRSSYELTSATLDPSGLNLTTTFTYDQVGNVLSEDGPRSDGDVTTYSYDATRKVAQRTDPTAGGVAPRTRYAFNDDGRLTSTQASIGADWATETILYDTRGLEIQRTGPDGSPVTLSYDAAGRPEEMAQTVDGIVRRSRNVLDPGGRLIAMRLAANTPLEQAVMSVTFSPNGRILTRADASGHLSTFCYDGHDRLIERRYPDPAAGTAPTCAAVAAGGSLPTGVTRERYTFASNGDLSSVLLRDTRTISFSYDTLGRMTAKHVPEADRSVTYSYDLLGRRTAASLPAANAALSVSWAYDKASRVLTSTGPYSRAVTYSYDSGSTWFDLQWPDAARIRYASDPLGRVTAVSDQTNPATLASFSYDELSRRTSVLYGNTAQTSYGYNSQYRLSTLSHDFAGTAQDVSFGFTYNEAGEILSRSVSNNAYETLSPGAIQQLYRPAPGSTATGGNGLNQYRQIDPAPTTLAYDPNGNLTQDSDPQRVWDYVYDSENRLVAVNDIALTYDAVGRLAEVRNGSEARRFLYDGVDRIAEYNATGGALLSRIVHGPAVDEPLMVEGGTSRTWLHGDERGSVVALADGGGTATQINTYGVWGEPGPTNTGRFGFTGQMRLGGTGLYHFKARAYSPILGRFLQTDPIGEQGGMNLYAYALNDPVNLIDPYGLQSWNIQLPTIYVPSVPSIDYAALNAMLQNTLSIAVPGYAASNSAMLNFQQGNYWASAGYGSLAVAELTLTGVTIGQYAAWSAAARGAARGVSALGAERALVAGLEMRGVRPALGTRTIPEGIPEGWRIGSTRTSGGVRYFDPANKGNAVRVMQGNPRSPFPSSQAAYVRWQHNGQALDARGNMVSKWAPDAHIPLGEFKFVSEVFR